MSTPQDDYQAIMDKAYATLARRQKSMALPMVPPLRPIIDVPITGTTEQKAVDTAPVKQETPVSPVVEEQAAVAPPAEDLWDGLKLNERNAVLAKWESQNPGDDWYKLSIEQQNAFIRGDAAPVVEKAAAKPEAPPNIPAETVDFLGLFFAPGERICFRAFLPKGKKGTGLKRYGSVDTLQKLWKELCGLNQRHGIYFVVNYGGDCDNDITRFNACFAESDTMSIEEQHRRLDACPLPTTARVETARSVHAYWRLSGDVSPQDWEDMQIRLIAFLDGDASIKNNSRVMRVPGFDHIDKNGVRTPVRVVQSDPERVYTIGELLAAFPAAERSTDQPKVTAADDPNYERSQSALAAAKEFAATAEPAVEGRNGDDTTFKFFCKLRDFGLDIEEGLEVAEPWNARCQPPWGPGELRKKAENAYQYAKGELGSTDTAKDFDVLPESRARLICMAEVRPKPVVWVWEPRLPIGAITMLEGDPGAGKSTICARLAAEVSNGRSGFRQGGIVWLSAEDEPENVIKPRLMAAGADCSRIFVDPEPFNLGEGGIRRLDGFIQEYKPLVVIIDPMSAYMGDTDTNADSKVRKVLSPLKSMAAKYQVAVLCVRHLTKGGRDKAIYRGSGSIAFTGAARSVLLAGQSIKDKDQLALVHIKNNLGPKAEPLGYKLEPRVVEDIKTTSLEWTGDSEVQPEDILGSELDPAAAKPSARDEAVKYLYQKLRGGPQRQKDTESEAKVWGISRASLRRAKDTLGVESYKSGYQGGSVWMWRLPAGTDLSKTDLGAGEDDFMDLLGYTETEPPAVCWEPLLPGSDLNSAPQNITPEGAQTFLEGAQLLG